jgi:hypothetical protein
MYIHTLFTFISNIKNKGGSAIMFTINNDTYHKLSSIRSIMSPMAVAAQ